MKENKNNEVVKYILENYDIKNADDIANETRKVVEKSEQLAKNKAAGKAKEGLVKKHLESELKEGEELLEQASFKLSNGKRAQPDFTVVKKSDKSVVKIVDSKAGNAKLSKNQKELQKSGGTLTGKKAGEYAGSSTSGKKIEVR